MQLPSIFRDTWRLTWKHWQLWGLNLLLFLVTGPALALTGGLGGLAGLMSLPLPTGLLDLTSLRQIAVWQWVLIAIGLWSLLVAATTASWTLQVAAVRGAALAADHGALTMRAALRIGRQRFFSILKLGLTFGVLLMAISLLPSLLTILVSLLPPNERNSLGLIQLLQTGLAPLNALISLTLFLVMMSIAVEDLSPFKAFRRSWGVLRQGWWGFLIVLAISSLPIFALALLLLPLAVLAPLAMFLEFGQLVLLLCGGLLGFSALFIILFTAVFTTTMYTLIYRASAQLIAPGLPTTPLPN